MYNTFSCRVPYKIVLYINIYTILCIYWFFTFEVEVLSDGLDTHGGSGFDFHKRTMTGTKAKNPNGQIKGCSEQVFKCFFLKPSTGRKQKQDTVPESIVVLWSWRVSRMSSNSLGLWMENQPTTRHHPITCLHLKLVGFPFHYIIIWNHIIEPPTLL